MSDPSKPYRMKLEDVQVITDPSELVALELRNLHKRLDNIEALLIEVRDELRKRKPYQTPTLTERPRVGDPDFRCHRCGDEISIPVPGRNREGFKWLMCTCGTYWAEKKVHGAPQSEGG